MTRYRLAWQSRRTCARGHGARLTASLTEAAEWARWYNRHVPDVLHWVEAVGVGA